MSTESKNLYDLHEEFTEIKCATNYLMECHQTTITYGFREGIPTDKILNEMGDGIAFLNNMIMEKMKHFQDELWEIHIKEKDK